MNTPASASECHLTLQDLRWDSNSETATTIKCPKCNFLVMDHENSTIKAYRLNREALPPPVVPTLTAAALAGALVSVLCDARSKGSTGSDKGKRICVAPACPTRGVPHEDVLQANRIPQADVNRKVYFVYCECRVHPFCRDSLYNSGKCVICNHVVEQYHK